MPIDPVERVRRGRADSAAANDLEALRKINPSLDASMQKIPGLKKLLGQNRAALFRAAPPGVERGTVTWQIWGHATIPQAERDQDVILVIARGPSHPGRVTIPLEGGGSKVTSGQIVFAGRAGELPHGPASDGGDLTDVTFPVVGKDGDKIELLYMRIRVNEKGQANPNGGWPNSLGGAYDGREHALTMTPRLSTYLGAPP